MTGVMASVRRAVVADLVIAKMQLPRIEMFFFHDYRERVEMYLVRSSRHPWRDLERSVRSTISEKHVPMADLHM